MCNETGPGRLKSALFVVALKTLISSAVLASGFRSVSDDDFARIVIAQQFASAPSWDPSRTSWLPLPFWLNGAAMLLFGRDLWVARAVALVLGIAAALAIWVAARWLGASRLGALVGAAVAASFPYSAVLGTATVPEAPTAALMVLGAAGIVGCGAGNRRAILGAMALGAATLCRYEAWPLALGACGVLGARAVKARSATLGAAASAAVAPAMLWLLHGELAFGDAFFFVKRVADYKHALGSSETWGSAFDYPLDFVRYEPELVLALAAAVVTAWRAGLRSALRRYSSFALLLATVLLFLVASSLSGGAPTHHEERALLALWFACALIVGDLGISVAQRLAHRPLGWTAATLAIAVLGGGLAVRSAAQREPFVDRRPEIDIGSRAESFLDGDGKLAIATDDFGFFAVIAALGLPERAAVLRRHDPRQPEPKLDLEATRPLRATLRDLGATLVVLPRTRASVADRLGNVLASNARLVLVELEPPPRS